MSFAELKKDRSKSLESLSQQLEKMTSKGYADPEKEKYWNLTRDAAGNGFAIIRFLPATEGEDLPFIPVWDHAFKSQGGWYIENSLTTLNQKDPVSEYNSTLWNSGIEANKEIARKQKRKLTYIANILVVSDPANPSNEGQIKLYKFGKKIFDKIMASMQPQFDDEKPVNPFDFWEGANFKLKLVKKDGYWNYDKSEFAPSSALLGDDDELETIYKSLNNLNDFIAPGEFKSYEDLKKRLDYTLGLKGTPKYQDPETIGEDEEVESSHPVKETTSVRSSASSDDEDDDALSYFSKLANS